MCGYREGRTADSNANCLAVIFGTDVKSLAVLSTTERSTHCFVDPETSRVDRAMYTRHVYSSSV